MSDEKSKSEIDYDDPIDPAACQPKNVILPEGEAMFVVMEPPARDRRAMGKLGTVKVVDVKFLVTAVTDAKEEAEITVGFPRHPDTDWKTLQFFTALGMRKHGDTGLFVPAWDKVDQECGRCVVAPRSYTNKSGEIRQVNDIVKFLGQDEEYIPKGAKAAPKTAQSKSYKF